LANNCSDASAEVVRHFAARRPKLRLFVVEAQFPAAVAHVGHARACLMDEACRRLLSHDLHHGVIASTDGDTCVAPDWLAATLAEVQAGVDAVGGRILIAAGSGTNSGWQRFTRRDATYQRLRARLEHALDPDPADPWPRHHQHFGASLAITARAYKQVGGLPAEPFLEDEALYQAMRRNDIKVRHSERVLVSTSNRHDGRVEVGLSWQLREWEALARSRRQAMVSDPVAWAGEVVLRRRLRRLWSTRRDERGHLASSARARVPAMAVRLGVPARWLAARLNAGGPFGAIWHDVLGRQAGAEPAAPQVTLGAAIKAMRALLAQHQKMRRAREDRVGRSRAASP
ncbi:MAG: hypothetical protein ABI281_00230, partial [Caldimonas sp.]